MQIEYLVHDAEKLPDLNRKFNFIVAIQSLEHILNDAEAMKGMRMSLNNDGHITITVPSKYCFFIYPTHGHRRYSLPIIKRLADIPTRGLFKGTPSSSKISFALSSVDGSRRNARSDVSKTFGFLMPSFFKTCIE